MNFKVVSCVLLVSNCLVAADATTAVRPYLNFRSQGANAALNISGTSDFYHKKEANNVETSAEKYGVATAAVAYTRSFDSDSITEALFGWNLQNCNTLKITGSEVANRNAKDLLADWFGLDGAYQGSISFKPVIQNAILDLNFYWGLDEVAKGLYFRVDAPLTWTNWNLGASFKTTNSGVVVQGTVTRLSKSSQYFCERVATLDSAPGATLYHPLNVARFCQCSCDDVKNKTMIADIRADLGWDFLRRENGHLGLFVRGVAPTGNRPNGRWLFEPIVGNGHYWELGGGLTADYIFWRNESKDNYLGFSVDANVTHFFNALQNRVFDLKNMPLSRYLTAFRSNEREITSVGNLTATTINSSFDVQADVVAMFNAVMGNWSADLGYNFWARTCEKINCSSWSNSCYAKGIVKNGYNEELIDASKWAVSPLSTIHTYVPPVATDVILNSDIDYEGAESKGMSHKVFGHVDYAWMDRETVPFIGIGAQGEFGRHEKCTTTTTATPVTTTCGTSCSSCSKSCCKNLALSQWGVWLKGGVSF